MITLNYSVNLLIKLIHVNAIFQLNFELHMITKSDSLTSSQFCVRQTAQVSPQLIRHIASW